RHILMGDHQEGAAVFARNVLTGLDLDTLRLQGFDREVSLDLRECIAYELEEQDGRVPLAVLEALERLARNHPGGRDEADARPGREVRLGCLGREPEQQHEDEDRAADQHRRNRATHKWPPKAAAA